MTDLQPEPSAPSARGNRRSGHSWLERGATHRWGWSQVSWGIGALVLGLVVLWFLSASASSAVGFFVANVAFWLVLLAAVFAAYRITVPRRLFDFRASDVVVGLALALVLRFFVDGLAWQANGFMPWPTFANSAGELPSLWWLNGVVAAGLIAPIVEELFFRGFLLVALYTVFCRLTSSPAAAAVAAAIINSGLFMLTHQVAGDFSLSMVGAVSTIAVGLTAAVVVLVTGRFWGALVMHVAFNSIWVLLALVGTIAGGAGAGATLS